MNHIQKHAILLAVCLCALPPIARAAGPDSAYLSVAEDTRITTPNQVLLTAKVSGGQTIFLCADGDLRPLHSSTATVFLTLDGLKVSNDATINWSGSQKPVPHSFRAIAALTLPAGPHLVTLTANGARPFLVGAGANLSIMTAPAQTILSEALPADSKVIEVNTPSLKNNIDPLPVVPVLTASIDSKPSDPVIVLAAGHSLYAGPGGAHLGAGGLGNGDAMWGLWLDDHEAPANNATYADNDIYDGAELQAPMFLQGLFNLSPGPHSIALGVSAEPWPEAIGIDGVRYKVGAGTHLITLQGGMKVTGGEAAIDPAHQLFNRFPYLCIASSKKWPACPATEQDVAVTSTTITVPQDHNGVIFFSANTRLQADKTDKGGSFEMWFTVDGVRRGSTGRQQLAAPSSVSTRTVTASYLAAGPNALTPGKHTIQLHLRATGDFIHMSITKNLPVLWFD